MLMVIVIGQIDLSVGSVAGFSGMLMALVAKTIEIIDSLQQGNGMPATDVTANNGKIDVSIYELDPVVVTKDNAKDVFKDDPDRLALLK